MNSGEYMRKRARIEQTRTRSGAWRKRALKQLQHEAGAEPVMGGKKLLGHRLDSGGQVCLKHRYKTQDAAEQSLQQILLERDMRRKPVRAYQCQNCGGWHLTSKA